MTSASKACSLALLAAVAWVSGCATARSSEEANVGIDSLNARIVQAYRTRDARAYGQLYTDSAIFEWPAFNSVRGRAALAEMARENWAAERDVALRLDVAARRLATDHATEFGAFQQTWTDSAGARMTEYGRYVTLVERGSDGRWRMARFFGFEDSTRRASTTGAAPNNGGRP